MRLFVCLLLTATGALAATDAAAQGLLQKIPLRFEQNSNGGWNARGMGFAVSMGAESTAINLGQEVLGVEFTGSDPEAAFQGEKPSQATSNYFFGRDFHSSPAFLRLRRAGIYPGIDVVYYGAGQALEYDFELAPGADPAQIRMRFQGARRVDLRTDGSLEITLREGTVTQKAPVTYQRTAPGEVRQVASRYRLENDGSYSLALAGYDETRPLVVDPELLFPAYLAGKGADGPISMGHDANGYVYIVGFTYSNDFPQVGNTYPNLMLTAEEHIFITKLNPLAPPGGEVVLYAGFFGGIFGEKVRAAAVDPDGVVYMTGLTDDKGFPVTENAYTKDNKDTRKMFVAALDTRIGGVASLKYSTFFGSSGTSEEPTALALGNAPGLVFIAGTTFSLEYPVKNPIQTARRDRFDGFVAEFDITKSGEASLVASTYLGGGFDDTPRSIAVDSANRVYVAGETHSFDFPITGGAYKPTYSSGYGDAFLTRLNLATRTIEYSTFLGGTGGDRATKVLLDTQGRVAVGGYTDSPNFPVTLNALQKQQLGGGEVFLTILNIDTPNFSQILQYSTLYGGNDGDYLYDMRIAPSGAYVLGGYTLSRNLPVVDALVSESALGAADGFVALVETTEEPSRALVYSSYVTGPGQQVVRQVDADAAGNIYVTGQATATVFGPGLPPPAATNTNVFFLVFRPAAPAVTRQDATKSPARNSRQRR